MAKYQFKRKPKSYQLRAIKKGMELDGPLAVLFDPGLGKTKVAIDLFAIFNKKYGIKRGLVLCPISALGVWPQEIKKDSPINVKVFRCLGKKSEKIKTIKAAINYKDPSLLLINYDSARIREITDLLALYETPFLVCDEIHLLKNPKSARSKAVFRLSQHIKYKIGLTGTLLPKDPLDIFGQYKVLDWTIFGTNYTHFKNHYANYMHIPMKNGRSFPKLLGFKNMEEMAKKIHSIAVRVKDTETDELEPIVEQTIPIPFTTESKQKYTEMAKHLVVELENDETITAQMAATKIIKLQQICGGFLMRMDKYMDGDEVKKQRVTFPVGTEKLDACVDLVEQHIEEHKFIIGCRFIWEIESLKLALMRKGHGVAMIKGGVSVAEREQIQKDFQLGQDLRIIIFQISAATAITLTAGTIGILYSSTYKWDDYWQWRKRIHRIGQGKTVVIYRLAIEGTIDEVVLKRLDAKQNMNELLVDSTKNGDYSWLLPKFDI